MKKLPPKKILIIDDEPLMLKALINAFVKTDFNIIKATDGKRGLALAKKEKPDLILLDIIMPQMDGLTMLKKLRQEKWGKRMPVMILTNLSDAESVDAALKNSVYDFLVKSDWKLKDLVKKVKDKLS